MSEERQAVVFESEMAAIKYSRTHDVKLFATENSVDGAKRWVCASSDHQARLAMAEHIWPINKVNKRERDSRYLFLLDEAIAWHLGNDKEQLSPGPIETPEILSE
jgi:ATP-dependent exoDNAse (exonuclease V) alpha subunit